MGPERRAGARRCVPRRLLGLGKSNPPTAPTTALPQKPAHFLPPQILYLVVQSRRQIGFENSDKRCSRLRPMSLST